MRKVFDKSINNTVTPYKNILTLVIEQCLMRKFTKEDIIQNTKVREIEEVNMIPCMSLCINFNTCTKYSHTEVDSFITIIYIIFKKIESTHFHHF